MTLMNNPPVTMEDFFKTSRGLWLIRRVVHHLDSQDDEAADALNQCVEHAAQHGIFIGVENHGMLISEVEGLNKASAAV